MTVLETGLETGLLNLVGETIIPGIKVKTKVQTNLVEKTIGNNDAKLEAINVRSGCRPRSSS
jgi:hypothetical protein